MQSANEPNVDFRDVLRAFVQHQVRFVVVGDLNIQEADFTRVDVVVQVGIPPNRIDILTGVTGLRFEDAWATHTEGMIEGVPVSVLGREALIQNKRAAGRHKDLGDVEALERESGSDPDRRR